MPCSTAGSTEISLDHSDENIVVTTKPMKPSTNKAFNARAISKWPLTAPIKARRIGITNAPIKTLMNMMKMVSPRSVSRSPPKKITASTVATVRPIPAAL